MLQFQLSQVHPSVFELRRSSDATIATFVMVRFRALNEHNPAFMQVDIVK
jgi:hypothetical protein